MNGKFAVILGNVGSCSDRFLSEGYSEQLSIDEMFEKVSTIEHVEGVELVGNWHISDNNVEQIKRNLKTYNLKLVSIIPDHFGLRKWGKGAFCSKSSNIRKDAIRETKLMIDIAQELGGDLISIWPGQDGYDYIFQADYITERKWMEEGIKECCQYNKNVKISVEYKIKEPRTHSYINSVSGALLMVNSIHEDNCGVTIDFGHSLMSYENVAESVALLKMYGDKLFHVHMNDNYRLWDDDMIVGSVHTLEYIEFFYWLKRTGYNGWLSIDEYPYREVGRDAVQESIYWMYSFKNLVEKLDNECISRIIDGGNAVDISRFLRSILFER